MKNVKEKVVRFVIGIAHYETKVDLNSTGSAWSYQPRLPKKAINYKKK